MTTPLTPRFASYIKKQIKSGIYTSQSEVLEAGLRALMKQEEAYTDWLNRELAAAERELAQGKGTAYDLPAIIAQANASAKPSKKQHRPAR